jgi:hypothetical protein
MKIDRILLAYRLCVATACVLYLLFFSSCGPTLKAYPKWPTQAPSVMNIPQKDPLCGKEKLKEEPRSRSIKIEGHVGVWISQKRARCLLTRAKIGRTCRSSCFTLLAKHKQADDHVQKTVTVSWINYTRTMQYEHRRAIRKIVVISIVSAVAVTAGAFAIGYVVGQLAP